PTGWVSGLVGGLFGVGPGEDHVLDLADLRQRLAGLGAELGQHLAAQRLRRRHGHRQWVAVHAVDAEFVVQVRAGGQAAGTDVADGGALADALSGADLGEARHVRVQRAVAAAVVEHHGAPVAALPADEGDPRVAGGHDRGAVWRGEVHALVRTGAAQHRVLARAGEARADAGVLHRHANEGLLQRAAVGIEVLGLAVVLEAERGVRLAAHGEGGGLDVAGAQQLALAPDLLHDHAEAVAGDDVGVEVDVVLEDLVGQLVDGAARQPELARRPEQRTSDLAADHDGAGGGRALDHLLVD